MAWFILTDTGKIVVQKSVWNISNEYQQLDTNKDAMRQLNKEIATKVGESLLDTDIDSDLMDDLPEIPDTLFTDDNEEENVTPI